MNEDLKLEAGARYRGADGIIWYCFEDKHTKRLALRHDHFPSTSWQPSEIHSTLKKVESK